MSALSRCAITVLALSSVFLAVAQEHADAPADEPVFTVLGVRDAAQADALVREAGGRLTVFAPDTGIAVVAIDDVGLALLQRDRRVTIAARGPMVPDDLTRTTGRARIVAGAWQRAKLLERLPVEPKPDGSPLDEDALVPPRPTAAKSLVPELAESSPGPRPAGAASFNTSEYMAGRVSLNLFLMESTTDSTEDWDATQEGQVYTEAIQAANSLATMYPGSELQFVLHAWYGRTDARVRVGCEPIAHAARSNDGSNCYEDAWTKTILAAFGSSAADMWTASRNYADSVRIADLTDWAVNVFVAHSYADTDGKFSDGRFGYAWIGGPHIVLTYDNDGWGVSRFDHVLRHELHHSFFAWDEYSSSNCTCTQIGGYLAYPNDNCQRTCLTTVTCVMINNVTDSCAATRAQVGTVDSDADGTADLLETTPTAGASLSIAPTCSVPARITGTATVGFAQNRNTYYGGSGNAISVLEISGVEYRVDSGDWTAAGVTATDGAFDAYSEGYSFDVTVPAGAHTVDVRAVDGRGNRSSVAAVPVTRPGLASPVTDTLRATRFGADAARLTWTAAAGASGYNVRAAAQPNLVASDAPSLVAGTTFTDAGKFTTFYLVSTVNACGVEVP